MLRRWRAEGTHWREKELRSSGTFAGGAIPGSLATGTCMGVGIAAGEIALL